MPTRTPVMNQWHSPLGKITIMIAIFLAAGIWSGCGLSDRTIHLPNGYQLAIEGDRWAWVTNERGHAYQEIQVIDIDWDETYIYGRSERLVPYGNQFQWFVINTADGSIKGFTRLDDWEEFLYSQYVWNVNLQSPSSLAMKQTFLIVILFIFTCAWVTACAYYIWKKLKRRRVHPDRL